jgi:hypothetical protein
MKMRSTRAVAAATLVLAALPALAHEGHGLGGATHWHATDAWGFIGLALVLALALWLTRGGK